MSYRPGQHPWVVYNPWVFANYGQPQRRRGYVSPVAFQTAPPSLGEGEAAIGAIGGVVAVGLLIYLGARELKAGSALVRNKVVKHRCRCAPPRRRRRRR